MFIDYAVVTFISGDGGDGCVSFRRERFIPKGGPDGGDGGKGGDIILISKKGKSSLVDFRFRKLIRAEDGRAGMGGNKKGRNGEDVVVYVPAGTVIRSYPEELVLFDFNKEDQSFTIVRGGKGGRGNASFKSSTNQAPKKADRGYTGERLQVLMELKLIAFAGIIGLPNAGKSTLISRISNAKPKIADYPFTTLKPHLGVIYNNYESLVVADIPGIITGAHKGEGMGLKFLRHIDRTHVLIFLIDASPVAENGPMETYQILLDELGHYSPSLVRKERIVVANKIDLLEDERPLNKIQLTCKEKGVPFVMISALKAINLDELKKKLFAYHYEA